VKRSQRRLAATATSIAVALLCHACAPVRAIVPPAGPIVLALIAWNMHAESGDIGRLMDDLAAGTLAPGRSPAYVLLLQEAVQSADRDIRAIAEARRAASFFIPVRISAGRATGNAIVSSVPLSDTHILDLPRERQPRIAAAGTIDVAGERLFVVSVHLENRLSWWRLGIFADTARGRQAEALVGALPPGHGIVGGDMNTMLGPVEPAWRTLLQRFPDTPPEDPQPTFRDRLVLDHLFFDLPDGWTATRQVIADRYGSDHHPVLGVIRRAP
jgi:endonuclease/exonuclease/phosphatase family metal-dependent hydrolase